MEREIWHNFEIFQLYLDFWAVTVYTELVGKKETAEEVAGSDILYIILTKVTEERMRCKAVTRTAAL